MYSIPPALAASLVNGRNAELRRQAAGFGGVSPIQPARHSLRATTGWFLVHLGLHLALPGSSLPAATP
jgi:hypothetical protein